MSKDRVLIRFLRFNDAGAVEMVTWKKFPDGAKESFISEHKPSPEELLRMASSKYAETHVHHEQAHH